MIKTISTKKTKKKVGHVVSYFSGVAKITGLTGVFLHELIMNERKNPVAIVIGFAKDLVEVLFFSENTPLDKPLFRSQKTFSININDQIVGRVLDGLGEARDGLGKLKGTAYEIFKQAPPIIARKAVNRPLSTGIKIIDAALSLGRGQRELIIGDQKLGKTTLVQDIVLNQKHAKTPVICIYVSCGQKKPKMLDMTALFENNSAFLYTTVIATTAEDSYASQYLAPFVGCAIGEYFRDQGQDALIIYDDLSKHAKIYRSISLLLERSPGREAYPGDIFSIHAGLLERAAQMSDKNGGGSLTALPIIETQEGDITSFIPTNIISITDGQIYLESGLLQKGFLPAVNVGLSVSRLGSQVQPAILKEVVGGIRLSLSQHKELQKLTQLETVVSDIAQKKIHRGDLTLQLLTQEKHSNVSWPAQVILFYLVEEGFFDDMGTDKWSEFEKMLLDLLNNKYSDVLDKIEQGIFDKKIKIKLQKILSDFKEEFMIEK